MNIIRAIIDARLAKNMTQKDLSNKTGINQSEINLHVAFMLYF